MLYLLRARDDNYALCEQTDTFLNFANRGQWAEAIPYPVKTIDYSDDFTGNIYWWQAKYPQYCDAKLIRKFQTLDDYNSYMSDHPELLL